MHERGVAEELNRKLGPVDREHVQAELPTVRVDAADVGQLHGAEPTGWGILPRIEGITRDTIPMGELESRAVAEDAELAPHLPFR